MESMELRRPAPGAGGPQGRAPPAGRGRHSGPSGQSAAQQAQAVQLDQNSTAALNLTVLQRQDPAVEEILLTAGHVTLYDFDVASSTWVSATVDVEPSRLSGHCAIGVTVPCPTWGCIACFFSACLAGADGDLI